MIFCVSCRREIENPDRAWQKVEGWERKRQQGGTNAIRLRKPLQEFMCLECMVRESLGFGADQGSLL